MWSATASGSTPAVPGTPEVPADLQNGIRRLMTELESMPGIPETVKKGTTRKWFYDNLQRRGGESIVLWMTRFRLALQRCDEDGVSMTDQEDLGWWLIRKTNLSAEREERLTAATGGSFDYATIERHMLILFQTSDV